MNLFIKITYINLSHTMSYNFYNNYYNYNCRSYARDCASGCCNASGECATSLSNCVHKYYDFSYNYRYTLSSRSSLNAEYIFSQTWPSWTPLFALFVVAIISILICYCIRKKWVQAVNRFDTDASMISSIINREAHIVPATSAIRHNQFVNPHYV